MEMMDRPMAVADAEAVAGGDRGTDERLGVANRGFQILALGEASGDGRRQRASGAVGILGCNPWRGKRDRAALAHQVIDALAALPVPALDQHGGTAERQQPPALILDRGLV